MSIPWIKTRLTLRLRRAAVATAVTTIAVGLLVSGGVRQHVMAQSGVEPNPAQMSAIRQAHQALPLAVGQGMTVQTAPAFLPQSMINIDPTGLIGSFNQNGATVTANNAFFQNIGTNGRTCFTCHQPQSGWSVTPQEAEDRFEASSGNDPLFRAVDGTNCPSADQSSLAHRRAASSLLLNQGLIRVGLQLPPTPTTVMQYQIVAVQDPYNCNTNPAYGLTSFGPGAPTVGIVSVYRRPLASTNTRYQQVFQSDGREPSLASLAVDATMIHAQGVQPTTDQVNAIVSFVSGLSTAQSYAFGPGDLTTDGAAGGPDALSQQPFSIGVNDPFGNNPTGVPFNSQIFNLYANWAAAHPYGTATGEHRASVARGEAVFNTKPITITGVMGLNDVLAQSSINGFCGTCHDTPNAGNHSVKAPLNIGVVNSAPVGLNAGRLPVFTILCNAGPLQGQTFVVTDPGKALITGQCGDIGRFRGPVLRGLASRLPLFHNGTAATFEDVVNFYDNRFGIGFTDREKEDLIAFLGTL